MEGVDAFGVDHGIVRGGGAAFCREFGDFFHGRGRLVSNVVGCCGFVEFLVFRLTLAMHGWRFFVSLRSGSIFWILSIDRKQLRRTQ